MERKMGREEERGKEGERRGKVRVEGGRGEKEEAHPSSENFWISSFILQASNKLDGGQHHG